MSISLTKISEDYSVCAQISVDDLNEIAKLGFKTVINNRPDLEGGETQVTSSAIQAAANRLGLAYYHIPVIPNQIQPSDVLTFKQAFCDAPKPAIGFCRTGNRASRMFELMQQS